MIFSRWRMKSATVIMVLAAALVASLLAAPLTECFLEAERAWVALPWSMGTKSPAMIDRGGNAGYGPFDRAFQGGWLPNGVPDLPLNIYSV